MVLVDTSVLISYLKGQDNNETIKFNTILERNIPYGITNHIYQELLQGARDENEFNKLKEYFSTQIFFDLQNGKKSYEDAALINIKCRKSGYTIRSTIDLIITQTAIENNLLLLHQDKDFIRIAEIIKTLKFF